MIPPPPRVLIVDDTPASLSLLAGVLEPHGYEILPASNGRVALQLAARALPDLILLDVMMPGHDGFYVCREMKADPTTRDIPVIFITSRRETAFVINGFGMGAVDYIEKPFQAEEVVTRVATHLKISRLTRELQLRKTSHPFPGNVRELKNVMERALILSAGQPVSPMHLQLFPATSYPTPIAAPASKQVTAAADLPINLEAAEQVLIQRALEQTQGNVAEAARLLNINRSRIYRKFSQATKT